MRLKYAFPLLLVFVLGCRTPSNGLGDEHLVVLKIYHTNDIHAHLSPDARGRGGLAYLASILRLVREQDHDSLILDAGDFYKKGSLPAQKSDDQVTADIMGELPYWDVRAVGNNEIKVGIPKLLEWSKSKEHAPLLSANFVDKDKKPVFQSSIIISKDNLKIGIIGLTEPIPIEPQIQADSKKDPRAPYTVLQPEDVVTPLIKALRPQVDVLIVLSHQVYAHNQKFLKAHPEVDLVVSGHSHVISGDQKKHGTGLVVEAGQFADQIGAVTLVYDSTAKKVLQIDSTFWPVGSGLQVPDQKIQTQIRDAYAKWAPDAFTQIGVARDELEVLNDEHPYEGGLNDWAADVFCKATSCDVALVNRELLREPFYRGILNKESLFFSVPYGDRIALVTMSKDALEKRLTESIQKVFDQTGLMEYSFSGINAHLAIHNHALKRVRLQFKTDKKNLKVALPYYLTTHCTDFFKKEECPLPQVEKDVDTKTAFEQAILTQKELRVPPADRVTVREFDKPEAITSDDDDNDDAEISE